MAIHFESNDGRFVYLDAVGYESDFHNWPADPFLMIDLDVCDSMSRWERLDSALESSDLIRFATSIRSIADGTNQRGGLYAVEPMIEMTIDRDSNEN